jgi:AAA domain
MPNGRGGDSSSFEGDPKRLAEELVLKKKIKELQKENERLRRELVGDRPNGKTHAEDFPATVTLVKGSEIEPVAVRWIWRNWLAEGKLEILARAVATGKTTLGIDWAATITSRKKWPDGTQVEIGAALIWSGEDDPDDTLLPRFLAAGGVRERIHFVRGTIVGGKKRAFDPVGTWGRSSMRRRESRR